MTGEPCSQLGNHRHVECGTHDREIKISLDHHPERRTPHSNWLARTSQQTEQPQIFLYLLGLTLQRQLMLEEVSVGWHSLQLTPRRPGPDSGRLPASSAGGVIS